MEKEQIKEKLKKAKSVLQIGTANTEYIINSNGVYRIGIDKDTKNRAFFNRFIITDGNYATALNLMQQRVDITIITLSSKDYNLEALKKEAQRFTNGEVYITDFYYNLNEEDKNTLRVHYKGVPQKHIVVEKLNDCEYNLDCKDDVLEIPLINNPDYEWQIKSVDDDKFEDIKPFVKKEKKKRVMSQETKDKIRNSQLKKKNKKNNK